MATRSSDELTSYRYNVDVERQDKIYGLSGKILYRGRWVSRKNEPILIVEMSEMIARHEAFFYRTLNNHRHIIRTFGYVENVSPLTTYVQEFAPYGDLANLIYDQNRQLTAPVFIEMFRQIADAMAFVASKSIVHADLGCRNVLVYRINRDKPNETLVKITDFGLARSLRDPLHHNEDQLIVPIRYCAPEILRRNHLSSYSEESDVYSMGVLIWEALSNGEMPYSSIASDDDVKKTKLRGENLPRPAVCNTALWTLMNNCWSFDATKRMSFEQMKQQLAVINTAGLSARSVPASPAAGFGTLQRFQLGVDVQITGSYGKLHHATWVSRQERPIVLINIDDQPSQHEMLFYSDLRSHQHIVHTFGYIRDEIQSIMLVQEQAPLGNLQDLLVQQRFRPNLAVIIQLSSQIVDAMIYVVKRNLIHGDLCCANVLVFQMNSFDPSENRVKLSNFRLAHQNDANVVQERRSAIPVRYCALEIIRSVGRLNNAEASEIYSMGVLMWQMCSYGEIPYHTSTSNGEVRQRKLNGEKLPRPTVCTNALWSIISDCWLVEPRLRYNFEQTQIRLKSLKTPSENFFELNVNIRAGIPLGGHFGKKLHAAEWIPNRQPEIILLMIPQNVAQQELPFYTLWNSHSNIVQTLGLVKSDPQWSILVQERAQHGNLLEALQTQRFQPTEIVLLHIFLQILDAMRYLDQQEIVHGDLRCSNILVFQMNSNHVGGNLVKLSNFHKAYKKGVGTATRQPMRVSARYCAIELLNNSDLSNYSTASDVYSMGILMWQACSKGTLPYGPPEKDDATIRQLRLAGEQLSKPNRCEAILWNQISGCCYQEPTLRYSFENLFQLLTRICRNMTLSRRASEIPTATDQSNNSDGNHLTRTASARGPAQKSSSTLTDLPRRSNSVYVRNNVQQEASPPVSPVTSKSFFQRLMDQFRQ